MAIDFDEPVSTMEAIQAAEEYLSEPATQEYYDDIKDDHFVGMQKKSFSQVKKKIPDLVRGDLLSDNIYLERIRKIGDGEYFLRCGS